MARGAFLTEMEKDKITAFREEGLSFRQIARKIKRYDKVVRNFIKNPSDYGQKKQMLEEKASFQLATSARLSIAPVIQLKLKMKLPMNVI